MKSKCKYLKEINDKDGKPLEYWTPEVGGK
jgi:hypothetical protein